MTLTERSIPKSYEQLKAALQDHIPTLETIIEEGTIPHSDYITFYSFSKIFNVPDEENTPKRMRAKLEGLWNKWHYKQKEIKEIPHPHAPASKIPVVSSEIFIAFTYHLTTLPHSSLPYTLKYPNKRPVIEHHKIEVPLEPPEVTTQREWNRIQEIAAFAEQQMAEIKQRETAIVEREQQMFELQQELDSRRKELDQHEVQYNARKVTYQEKNESLRKKTAEIEMQQQIGLETAQLQERKAEELETREKEVETKLRHIQEREGYIGRAENEWHEQQEARQKEIETLIKRKTMLEAELGTEETLTEQRDSLQRQLIDKTTQLSQLTEQNDMLSEQIRALQKSATNEKDYEDYIDSLKEEIRLRIQEQERLSRELQRQQPEGKVKTFQQKDWWQDLKLDADQREIVELIWNKGMSIDEVADLVGISSAKVGLSILFAVRKIAKNAF